MAWPESQNSQLLRMSTYIIMAEVLGRLVADPHYSELRVENTAFQDQFRAASKPIAAVAIGHSLCGKSELLNKFLSSGPGFSHAGEEVALWACPQPVALGDSQLFLLKLSGFSRLDDDYLKMIYVTMRVADWVFVCLERTAFFSNLKTILTIGKEANVRRGKPIERIYIMVESQSWLSRAPQVEGIQKFQQHPLAVCCQFLERGSALTDSLFRPIRTTLLSQAGSQARSNPVPELLLSLSAQFAFCVDYHDFANDYSSPEELRREREQFRRVGAQPLFIKRRGEIELNDGAMEALQQCQANPETPTVVLMIFGHPGLGKSTFLNHIYKELLRAKTLPELFRVGNTTTHTTQESEFLPLPLHLTADLQMIIVDLEGLEGAENIHRRIAETQRLLVAALLAVASVPCIIVGNESDSLHFIEKQLKAISSHQQQFGYLVEKIVLLFHDKEITAGENEDMVKEVERMKKDYKLQNTDIEIVNKPSFVISEEKSRRFVQSFLAKCTFPKRHTAGRCLPIADIVAQFHNVIDSVKQVTDIILTSEEEEIVRNTATTWERKVDNEIEKLSGNEDRLCEKAELEMRTVMETVEKETDGHRMGLKRVIRDGVESYIRTKVEGLRRIESVYRQIFCLDPQTLHKHCSHLPVDLNLLSKVTQFYPHCKSKVQTLLPKLKSRIDNIVVTLGLAVGMFYGLYSKNGTLRDIWRSLKEDLGRKKLSLCFIAGSITSSVLTQIAVLPAPYAGHRAVRRNSQALAGLSRASGVLMAVELAALMSKKGSVAWYAGTGLALIMSISFWMYFTRRRKAEIRALAEIFHCPDDLLPFYRHIKDEELTVLFLLGVNSGAQQRFSLDFLSLCYPHSLLTAPISLATGLDLLPFSYLSAFKQLSNGLIVSLALTIDPFQVSKHHEFAAKMLATASATVIFLEEDTVNPSITLCFGEVVGKQVFVGYTRAESAGNDCCDQLRRRNFQVELRNLQETKQFAKEMYTEKLGSLGKVKKSGVQEAFRSILPF